MHWLLLLREKDKARVPRHNRKTSSVASHLCFRLLLRSCRQTSRFEFHLKHIQTSPSRKGPLEWVPAEMRLAQNAPIFGHVTLERKFLLLFDEGPQENQETCSCGNFWKIEQSFSAAG